MLKIYNTLSGKKEEFVPVDKDGRNVNMYVCGITPYDEVHLGHARCYVVFDVIRRYLKYKGYAVKYIQNFTDIDDKIISRSLEAKIPLNELAQKYIGDYFTQMRKLNIRDADSYPRVTQKIPDIISFIKKIIDNGYGYVSDGDVYFSVRKFKDYGKLSKRNVDDLKSGSRVLPGEQKRDPLDFALWKKAKDGEPYWESPWGKGRPGWHIECSAMSLNEFGFETFDIHGGGQDLIFPHHENEIAQSEAVLGNPFVKYWIHNGFVTINKEKMSKSLGNFFTLREIFEKYQNPKIVRYMLLAQHYRQPLDFTEDKLEQAKTALSRIFTTNFNCETFKNQYADGRIEEETEKTDKIFGEFLDSMDDDFNTPEALAKIHEIVNNLHLLFEKPPEYACKNNIEENLEKLKLMCETVLGINFPPTLSGEEMLRKVEMEKLRQDRDEARKKKDWIEADKLRVQIEKAGYIIEDTKYGSVLKEKL